MEIPKGFFRGTAAAFGNVDTKGDVIDSGAFGAAPVSLPIFLEHQHSRGQIGIAIVSNETHGLHVVGQLDMKSEDAALAYRKVMDGEIKGLSIGFETVESATQDGVRTIKRGKLHEVSLVASPANRRAELIEMKGCHALNFIDGEIETTRVTAPVMMETKSESQGVDYRGINILDPNKMSDPAYKRTTKAHYASYMMHREFSAAVNAVQTQWFRNAVNAGITPSTIASIVDGFDSRRYATLETKSSRSIRTRDASYVGAAPWEIGTTDAGIWVDNTTPVMGLESLSVFRRHLSNIKLIDGVGLKTQRVSDIPYIPDEATALEAVSPEQIAAPDAPMTDVLKTPLFNTNIEMQATQKWVMYTESGLVMSVDTIIQAYDKKEAYYVINGNPTQSTTPSQPTGINNQPSSANVQADQVLTHIQYVPSGTTGVVTIDGIHNLYHSLHSTYRANSVWVMHHDTWSDVTALRDTNGDKIEFSYMNDGTPMLKGRPVFFDDQMDQVGADKKVIYFGDMYKATTFVDGTYIGLQTNIVNQITLPPNVWIYATRMMGFGVLDPRGIKILKLSAS